MDEIEINTELKKINALHPSLDESNVMTYIIFLESYRHRLNNAQIAWLDNKIDDLNEKTRLAFETSVEHVDVELAKKPLIEKFQDAGELSRIE
jgi:TATA-binding protein-associated factor Taf7